MVMILILVWSAHLINSFASSEVLDISGMSRVYSQLNNFNQCSDDDDNGDDDEDEKMMMMMVRMKA